MKIFKRSLIAICVIVFIIYVFISYDSSIRTQTIQSIHEEKALSKYYEATGNFPTYIDELVPKYIGRVPRLKNYYKECQLELYLAEGRILADKIKKYKDKNGFYPDSLEDLVPAYIKKLPKVDYNNLNNNYKYGLEKDKFFLVFAGNAINTN